MSQFSKIIFYKYLIFLCFVATLIDWKEKSPNFPYLACYKIELFCKNKKNPRKHSRRISNIFELTKEKHQAQGFPLKQMEHSSSPFFFF